MWAGGNMGTWGPVRKKGGGVMRGGGMCRREGGRTVPAIVVTHRFGSVSLSGYFELGVFGVGVLLALASAVLAAAVATLVY